MENFIGGSWESIETIVARDSFGRSPRDSTDSAISGSSYRADTLSPSESRGDILTLSNRGKIGISTN